MVFACWMGGDTIPPQVASWGWTTGSTYLIYTTLYRPATTLTQPGPVPVNNWWGFAQEDAPLAVGTNTNAQAMNGTTWLQGGGNSINTATTPGAVRTFIAMSSSVIDHPSFMALTEDLHASPLAHAFLLQYPNTIGKSA